MSSDKILTPGVRAGLKKAVAWVMKDPTNRTETSALEKFGLPRGSKKYLRILKAAHRQSRRVDILVERPRWMYALVFPKTGWVKIGVSSRLRSPRKSVDARAEEHAAEMRRIGKDCTHADPIWWAGSLEAESELRKRLGRPVHGREWFQLTDKVKRRIENRSGRTLNMWARED